MKTLTGYRRIASVTVANGAPDDADVTIDAGPGIRAVMAGEMSPDDAIAEGVARVTGDKKLFPRFAEIFRIEPLPVAPAFSAELAISFTTPLNFRSG